MVNFQENNVWFILSKNKISKIVMRKEKEFLPFLIIKI